MEGGPNPLSWPSGAQPARIKWPADRPAASCITPWRRVSLALAVLPSRTERVMHSAMPPTGDEYTIHPIGVVRSTLLSRVNAPRQGSEGAPDAWIEVDAAMTPALAGLMPGDEIIVLTWLHQAERGVLEVHPRGEVSNPIAGVFATRSPDRPNPIGLHRVTIREIAAARLRVGPIEAMEGTPVVDIKIAVVGDNHGLRTMWRRKKT